MLKDNRITSHMELNGSFSFRDPNPGPQGYGMIAQRGGIASRVAGTGPTTSSPDDVGNVVEYSVNAATAIPIGILIQDVMKIDGNRQFDNPYKGGFQARVENKVAIDPKGTYWTNMVDPAVTVINPEQPAYVGANGLFTNVQATSGGNSAPRVGTFKSFFDKDKYVQVKMNIS